MSNLKKAFNPATKKPENVSRAKTANKTELLSGIQIAREQARRHEGISGEEASKLVDAWASE